MDKIWTYHSLCVGEQACQKILKHFVVSAGIFVTTSQWNQWFSPAESKVVYLRCFLKTLCSDCSSNILSVTWFPPCGEPCRIRHFFVRLEPAKLITRIINKYNYRPEKKRPYQHKKINFSGGHCTHRTFSTSCSKFYDFTCLACSHLTISHPH